MTLLNYLASHTASHLLVKTPVLLMFAEPRSHSCMTPVASAKTKRVSPSLVALIGAAYKQYCSLLALAGLHMAGVPDLS